MTIPYSPSTFATKIVHLRRAGCRVAYAIFIVATARPQMLGAQCSVGAEPPTAIGPRTTAADSGRMYSHVVSADGRELYFFKRVGSLPEDYRIFRSIRNGSEWGSPERVSLGGDYSDLYPSLNPDGTRLVFSSYRPVAGDTTSHRNAHIWMAERRGDSWAAPTFVRASRLGYYHSGLRQDRNGNLHFRLTTPDWRGQRDVYLRWEGNGFEADMRDAPLAPAVEYWRRQAGDTLHVWGAITSDSLTLVSVSRVAQPGGRRQPAQYHISYPRGSGWTPLVRAGGGLGVGSPNFAWFSSDGCYIHYTRDYSEFMRVPVRTARIPLPN